MEDGLPVMAERRSQWRDNLSWSQSMPFAAFAVAGILVIVVGIYIFPYMLDDAYITYSSARNLARIGRLVYHPTNPVLNISAPLYAILLGIGGKLGFHIPALSSALGAASIFGSSAYLMALCYRHKMMWAAATAGLLLATSPMLWLTLGLETCFFLLLGLAAFYHFDREHYVAAAVLTACAILTRGDGLLVAGILVFYHLIVFAAANSVECGSGVHGCNDTCAALSHPFFWLTVSDDFTNEAGPGRNRIWRLLR